MITMSSFLVYFSEAFLCSGLFLLLYSLFIVRKAGYGFCRKYLIVTTILAMTIPMLDVPLYPAAKPESTAAVSVESKAVAAVETAAKPADQPATQPAVQPESASAAQAQATTEITSVSETQAEPSVEPAAAVSIQPVSGRIRENALLVIYLIGVGISLLSIAGGAVSVARIRRSSHVTPAQSYDLAESDNVETPFSFMHTVYLGYGYSEKERHHILSHEASHVHHLHSLEKLFMSVLRSIFWFNPLVWLAEKFLEDVQEWQADKDALSDGYRIDEYRQTIVNQLFGYNPEMVSGLKGSFTKRRLLKMKQTEYKGGIGLQTGITMLVAALLFLAFGCGRTKPADETFDYEEKWNSQDYIFTSDAFLGDFSGTNTRTEMYVYERDDRGRVTNGIEIYENKDYTIAPVTIAVNGVKRAKSLRDRKLRWIDKSTVIIIGGKKSTWADFRALKEGEYEKIYYYHPKGQRSAEYSFVYVSTTRYNAAYNYPVTVDKPGLDVADIILPHGMGSYPDMFIYQTDSYNVATPDARFVVDGKFISYNEFHKLWMDQDDRLSNITVYRNDAARKRFGNEYWEVVECSSRKGVYISYSKGQGGKLIPQLDGNGVEASYEQIISAIADAKAYNKTIGQPTIVRLRVDEDATDSQYKDLIKSCIDIDDPDVYLDLVRYRTVTCEDEKGNSIIRRIQETKADLRNHEYVDLGLSVKWATCNVDALNPEDFGGYYAWGETNTKGNYVWVTYQHSIGLPPSFNKYNTNRSMGKVDNITTLKPEDDVAFQTWGSTWRIPTKDELEELVDNCTWTWTTLNGVNGYRVTSNKPGFTDRSIFLPAAGRKLAETSDGVGSRVNIASSTLFEEPDGSYILSFDRNGQIIKGGAYREYGVPVRPVCE